MTNNEVNDEWRYEIKFIVNKEQESDLYSWISQNKTLYRAYPSRLINTIYFDDLENTSMFDNLSGVSSRVKYRIRWYNKYIQFFFIPKSSETNIASAWSNYQTSESILASIRAQVKAAEIANEGITEEYQRGSRSTLDFIQSTAILLDARISLANSERDFILAQYNLLKSVGLLQSSYLNIK